jgi:hypothetical protein
MFLTTAKSTPHSIFLSAEANHFNPNSGVEPRLPSALLIPRFYLNMNFSFLIITNRLKCLGAFGGRLPENARAFII